MKKKKKEKTRNAEEPCCADPKNCSDEDRPKPQFKCSCGGFCG